MEWATAIAARLAPMRRARRWYLAGRSWSGRPPWPLPPRPASASCCPSGWGCALSALRLFPGQTPAQEARWPGVGNCAMSVPISANDLGGAPPDPGDGVHRLLKRVHPPGYLLVQPPDLLLQVTEVAGWPVGAAPSARSGQLLELLSQPALGQLRQRLGVFLPVPWLRMARPEAPSTSDPSLTLAPSNSFCIRLAARLRSSVRLRR